MVRTQIQLPDDVFADAKRLCKAREISLAEFARRGIEYMLSAGSSEVAANGEWAPPTPRNLGWKGLTDQEIKREAQVSVVDVSLARRRKK